MSKEVTLERVLQSYQMLASNDDSAKQQANRFLFNLVEFEQAWNISNRMIAEVDNAQYKYLGAQILYQKIERELTHFFHVFSSSDVQEIQKITTMVKNLKQFLCSQININAHKSVIDKLSSSLGLLSILMLIVSKQENKKAGLTTDWNTLLKQIVEFMKWKNQNLSKGLIMLERLAEQLRNCTKFSFRHKNIIKSQLLTGQELLNSIWQSIFKFQESGQSAIQAKTLYLGNLTCIESWVKTGFPLFKHPNLLKGVLQVSIINFETLEAGSRVICETLKATAQNKFQVLSEVHPNKERQSCSTEEVESLKFLLEFVFKTSQKFLSPSMSQDKLPNYHLSAGNPMISIVEKSQGDSGIDPEYTELFIKIIDDLLRNYGFLLLEQNIGFQLLDLLIRATAATDLKLSSITFDFWMFLSEKMIKVKEAQSGPSSSGENPYLSITPKIQEYFLKLYQILLYKCTCDGDAVLDEAELKQDQTIDESGAVPFGAYRKMASDVFKCILEYFLTTASQSNNNSMEGSFFFFNSIFNLLKDEFKLNWRGVQLALFTIKSVIESIVDQSPTQYLLKSITLIIEIIEKCSNIPTRILAESMNLIRDCTRQIKAADTSERNLLIYCLKFVLKYIEDQKLCNYAAYCFQVLMETVNTIDDQVIVIGLLQYYKNQKQTRKQSQLQMLKSEDPLASGKALVIEKSLEGVFNAIVKFSNKEKIPECINRLMEIVIDYYKFKEQLFVEISSQNPADLQKMFKGRNKTALFHDCLLQIKTLLACYEASTIDDEFKRICNGQFRQLSLHTLQITHKILSIALNFDGKSPTPKYSLMNELGQCVSIYKKILKICSNVPLLGNQTLNNGGVSDQDIESGYVKVLDCIMQILRVDAVKQLCIMLSMISETLFQFTPEPTGQKQHLQRSSSQIITNWLVKNIPVIHQFFLQYYQHYTGNDQPKNFPKHNKLDPDIVKYYFVILQALLIHNRQLYVALAYRDSQNSPISPTAKVILEFCLFSLQWVNEKSLTRRLVSFLACYVSDILCSQDEKFRNYLINSNEAIETVKIQRDRILQTVIMSIPLILSPSHGLVGKIFVRLLQGVHQKQQIFEHLLLKLIVNCNKVPSEYQNIVPQQLSKIQQSNLKLLAQEFALASQLNGDRFIKLSLVHLNDVMRAFNGFQDQGAFISNQTLMQIEMSIVNWKRQIKKSQSQNQMG